MKHNLVMPCDDNTLLSILESFDRDLIDGTPAARFTRQMKRLIESGFGLNENEGMHETRFTT